MPMPPDTIIQDTGYNTSPTGSNEQSKSIEFESLNDNTGKFEQIKQCVLDFNLFESIPPSTDRHQLRSQRISTRIFILALALSLTILLVYTSAVNVTKTISIPAPDLQHYQELYQQYHQTLICPCEQISINYQTFLNISYTFHQVCGSFFITDGWILSLANTSGVEDLPLDDFRLTRIGSFQALKAFCELGDHSISTNMAQFYSNNYISASVTAPDLFQFEATTLVQQFISSATNSFSEAISMMRDTIQANALLAGHEQNYRIRRNSLSRYLVPDTRIYDGGCMCIADTTCVSPSVITRESMNPPSWIVPGFYAGCLATEYVRRSNLQCFYNDTCLNELIMRLNHRTLTLASVLNPSIQSRFTPDTTIGTILDHLMVEDWNWSIIYEHYYQRCQPLKCDYTISTKNDAIYIVTTLISLLGGLVAAFKIIIGRFLWLLKYQRRSQIVSDGQLYRESTLRRAMHNLRHFNLFESIPPSTDQHQLRTQRISTRIFILALALSLTILLVYTSTVNVTKTISVPAPDLQHYQELYQQYHQTLICPCQRISIRYETFLNISYTLHQVCNSYFITDSWILFFANITYEQVPYLGDFLLTSTQNFQTLRALCRLVENIIDTVSTQFLADNYVSALVKPKSLLLTELDAVIQQFVASTSTAFALSLKVIRDTTQANALLASVSTNYRLYVDEGRTSVSRAQNSYNGCICTTNGLCTGNAAIHRNISSTSAWYVRGIQTGCFLLQALRQSTLECFYDAPCFNELRLQMPQEPLINVILLNSSISSRFSINSTIGTMLDLLFVEKWIQSVSYDNYYRTCAPLQCTYILTTRNDFIYIMTILIGLIGGLITGLKMIVPLLVTFVYSKLRSTSETMETNVQVQNNQSSRNRFVQRTMHNLSHFNLFESMPPSTDRHQLRTQRISTRIFILALALSLTILIVYTSTVNITKTISVPAPDLQHYQELYQQYHETLTCPCEQISIQYETFLNISYTLYQVCSSYFATDNWLQFILQSNPGTLFLVDFRVTGRQIFQALKALCQLVDESIEAGLVQFYSTNYVSASVIAEDVFRTQSEAFSEQFILSTENSFALTLKRVRDITQANGLASVLSTNYKYRVYDGSQDLTMTWAVYDNDCSCGSSTECNSASYIYFNRSLDIWWPVPGFFRGCFGLESLRQCNLACFYNQTCLNVLLNNMNPNVSLIVSTLDPLLPSRFSPNTSLGTIVDLVMVETWTSSILYEQYYAECKPKQCTYKLITKNDKIYIITTLIGLVGGLVTALKLIIPFFVSIMMRIIQARSRDRSKIQPLGSGLTSN